MIAPLDEPRFQKSPIKKEGANWAIITKEISPIEYKDNSLEKEMGIKQGQIDKLEAKFVESKKSSQLMVDKSEFYSESQKIWKHFSLY